MFISATYGRLKTFSEKGVEKTPSTEQVEVTDILQKIVEQQGGNQLILNAGSKVKLFQFTMAKKAKKTTEDYLLYKTNCEGFYFSR